MLIFTRKVDDKIMIGDNIEICFLTNKNGQVKVGINAPKDVPVHRYEVYEKIKGKRKNN
ncbi:MAG: carbon storage regulator CsrA [Gammaproteobacteria bacterium]|nr:carbon storage regulator CsrA [Gammaproteobacteria bacterium]